MWPNLITKEELVLTIDSGAAIKRALDIPKIPDFVVIKSVAPKPASGNARSGRNAHQGACPISVHGSTQSMKLREKLTGTSTRHEDYHRDRGDWIGQELPDQGVSDQMHLCIVPSISHVLHSLEHVGSQGLHAPERLG